MKRNVLAATAAAALALVGTQSRAGEGSVDFENFKVTVLGASGTPDPAAAVFSGQDMADAEFVTQPNCGHCFGEEPGGQVFGTSAFAEVGAGTLLDLGPWEAATVVGFNGTADTGASLIVYAEGNENVANWGRIDLGGDSFQLAAHSEIVITSAYSISADRGQASASLAFGGPNGSGWSEQLGSSADSGTLSLTFANDTDATITGTFLGDFYASSLPEPGPAWLMLPGLGGLLVRRGAKRRS